jgi:hypothetical protein
MRRSLLCLFVLAAFVVSVCGTALADESAGAASDAPSQAASSQGPAGSAGDAFGGVKPVSPGEFVARVDRLVAGLNTAVGGLVVPLATFSMLVSVAALALGHILGLGVVKRFGWGGLFMTAVALLIFWGMPVIIGLIRALATSFAS